MPGDLLEFVALYPLCNDFTLLPQLTLFRQGQITAGMRVNALHSAAVKPMTVAGATASGANPWELSLRDTGTHILVSWNYPTGCDNAIIAFNGEVVNSHYSRMEHLQNGFTFKYPKSELNYQEIRVRVTCGEESYEETLALASITTTETLLPARASAKLKTQGLMLKAFTLDADINRKCVVQENGHQRFRLRLTSPQLWLPEGAGSVEVENLKDNEI